MRAKSKRQQLLAAPDERRQSCRLPITEPVHYKIAGRGKGGEQIGSGRTLNMSGNGVLFTTECFLAEGSRIELAVNWPVRLDGVALKLVVMGHVVWAEDERAAIAIKQYEFKTRKSDLSTTLKSVSPYRPDEANFRRAGMTSQTPKVTPTAASEMAQFSSIRGAR